jgi:hypothetical protein
MERMTLWTNTLQMNNPDQDSIKIFLENQRNNFQLIRSLMNIEQMNNTHKSSLQMFSSILTNDFEFIRGSMET